MSEAKQAYVLAELSYVFLLSLTKRNSISSLSWYTCRKTVPSLEETTVINVNASLARIVCTILGRIAAICFP